MIQFLTMGEMGTSVAESSDFSTILFYFFVFAFCVGINIYQSRKTNKQIAESKSRWEKFGVFVDPPERKTQKKDPKIKRRHIETVEMGKVLPFKSKL